MNNDTERNVFDKVVMLSSTKDLQKEDYDNPGKLLQDKAFIKINATEFLPISYKS